MKLLSPSLISIVGCLLEMSFPELQKMSLYHVFMEIFFSLSFKDLKKCTCVCSSWRNFIQENILNSEKKLKKFKRQNVTRTWLHGKPEVMVIAPERQVIWCSHTGDRVIMVLDDGSVHSYNTDGELRRTDLVLDTEDKVCLLPDDQFLKWGKNCIGNSGVLRRFEFRDGAQGRALEAHQVEAVALAKDERVICYESQIFILRKRLSEERKNLLCRVSWQGPNKDCWQPGELLGTVWDIGRIDRRHVALISGHTLAMCDHTRRKDLWTIELPKHIELHDIYLQEKYIMVVGKIYPSPRASILRCYRSCDGTLLWTASKNWERHISIRKELNEVTAKRCQNLGLYFENYKY